MKMKINNPRKFIDAFVRAGYFFYIPEIIKSYGKPLKEGMTPKEKARMIKHLSYQYGIEMSIIKSIINEHVI